MTKHNKQRRQQSALVRRIRDAKEWRRLMEMEPDRKSYERKWHIAVIDVENLRKKLGREHAVYV